MNDTTAKPGPQMISLHTPKGNVRHLALEHEQHTLCGKHHGINPDNVFVGTWIEDIQSSDNATCGKCRKVEAEWTVFPIEETR